MIKRAFLYARVSTDEQAKHGYSIGAQVDFLRKYAKENNYVVTGEFVDEGVSGRKGYKKRPAMRKLMESLEQTDVIIFLKLDRWFRSVSNYYETQSILDKAGVDWIAAQEDYETVTASGKFKVNIMLSVAQNEAERTSERIKFVFDSKRAKGEYVSSSVPLGYFVNSERHVEIDPEKAKMVSDIFLYYIGSRSIIKTRDYMFNTYGILYSDLGMRNMLRNTNYLGTKDIPAFLPRETFLHVQDIISSRSPRNSNRKVNNKPVFLFSGLVYCKECGEKMHASYHYKYSVAYYSCGTRSHYGPNFCSHRKNHREDFIENYLIENLVSSVDDYNLAYSDKIKNAPDLDAIRRKLEKLRHLYLEDLISKDDYEVEYREYQAALAEASSCLPRKIDTRSLTDSLKLYSKLTNQNKAAFWNRTIRRIVIDEKGEICIIPY